MLDNADLTVPAGAALAPRPNGGLPATRLPAPAPLTSAVKRSLFAVVPWLLAAAALLPTSAAAHVVTPDLIVRDRIPHTHPDELTEETLPIVHECPQVAAIIRAEDMTEFELTTACLVLQRTEDRYHAKLRTDPAKPVKTWYDKVEILIFNGVESMAEYYLAVFGRDTTAGGVYFWPIDEEHHPWTILPFIPSLNRPLGFWGDPTENTAWSLLKHEYVHHLDATYHGHPQHHYGGGGSGCVHLEGVAEYFSDTYHYLYFIGDGSNLPPLSQVWYPYPFALSSGRPSKETRYHWGYLAVRFLFEEHPQIMSDLYDFANSDLVDRNCWLVEIDMANDYANEALPPLDDEFERWLREFTSFKTVRQIEPVTLFLALDENGNPLRPEPRTADESRNELYDNAGVANVLLPRYIQSSRPWNLDFSVSFADDGVVRLSRSYGNFREGVHLSAVSTGTTEATLTVTAPDGKSAQQTFTVTVLNDLQSKEIVVRDPVSTEDGYLAVDLSTYFTGPALEDVEFIAASSDPDVAPVSLEGGRLVITAVSAGEAEVTVRGDYRGRVQEQTFTIVVTDECPLWLCRGTFTGWRSALLRTTETGDTPTTPGR